jgi:hypothetical protein
MPQPSVYYYPVEGGAIREVDFGYSLQSLKPIEGYDNPTTINGIGSPSFNPLLGRLRVHLRKERVPSLTSSGAVLAREFVALENHLRRGGVIGVALDRTKAFAAYVNTGLFAGGSTIDGGPNVYRDVLSSALAMAAGDTICLESGNPDWRREQLKINTVSVGSLTFSITTTSAIVYDRDNASGVMVRHRDFYPALFLPQDQQDKEIVTDENGTLWTFDAELQVAAGIYGTPQEDGPTVLEAGIDPAGDGHIAVNEDRRTGASLAWATYTRGRV